MILPTPSSVCKALALIAISSPLAAGSAIEPASLEKRATAWKPAVGEKWQILLAAPLKVTKTFEPSYVKAWTLDMADNDAATFTALHAAGKKVICYFSAGSYEDWRDDASSFKAADLGSNLDGWPGERWLNTKTSNVRAIMKKRIALAASKGCDAIDPDNIDGYGNDNGLGLTEADAIDYVKYLSTTAASYGLSIGLKNAGDIISSVLSHVDFATVEQCAAYKECATYQPFIKAGKPVFQIEYPSGAPSISASTFKTFCPASKTAQGSTGFTTTLKKMNLDGWVEYCTGNKYTSATQS
ncbi:hypothetical protein G7046_g575 [Stylonectria norvegica]|nr:hypothetical protein G7046_g575 [Stylonectria norvegica]